MDGRLQVLGSSHLRPLLTEPRRYRPAAFIGNAGQLDASSYALFAALSFPEHLPLQSLAKLLLTAGLHDRDGRS